MNVGAFLAPDTMAALEQFGVSVGIEDVPEDQVVAPLPLPLAKNHITATFL